ncbi:hypothetical protein PInf_016885 [Phytophthora infestans]|nr:hypothetical protein PInf_016885 [Phytophthora infestans]
MPSARNSVEEALDLGDDYVKSIGSDEAAIASAVIIPDGGNTGDDEEQDSESSLNYGIDSDEEDALSMNTYLRDPSMVALIPETKPMENRKAHLKKKAEEGWKNDQQVIVDDRLIEDMTP